jgi:hypothetical protein
VKCAVCCVQGVHSRTPCWCIHRLGLGAVKCAVCCVQGVRECTACYAGVPVHVLSTASADICRACRNSSAPPSTHRCHHWWLLPTM